MQPSPIITPPQGDKELSYAKRALALIQQYNVAPIPENYAIWYHYVVGENKELVREVDHIVEKGMNFSAETSSYLHNKFVLSSPGQKTVDDAAMSTEKVLADVLKVISEFASQTASYNKGVDDCLVTISQDVESGNVQNIVKNLVNATAALKKNGENITRKLEESTAEITHLKKDLQQVTIESQRDFLTGVFNRKTFEKYVDEQMATSRENNSDLCLLMIDIDHFKKFNDTFGHLLGDEVLKIVARTLTEILKGRDAVARFGGEEFVVILPETNINGAMKAAELIRSAIASKELKRKDTGQTFGTITVSIGVARFKREDDTLPTMIKRADDAMYISKHEGRNRVTCEAAT